MSYEELKSKIVVTRKPHHCEWCNEVIEIGESVWYRAYKYDGDFQAGYMHMDCEEAMHEAIRLEGGEFEWMPGDFPRGRYEVR